MWNDILRSGFIANQLVMLAPNMLGDRFGMHRLIVVGALEANRKGSKLSARLALQQGCNGRAVITTTEENPHLDIAYHAVFKGFIHAIEEHAKTFVKTNIELLGRKNVLRTPVPSGPFAARPKIQFEQLRWGDLPRIAIDTVARGYMPETKIIRSGPRADVFLESRMVVKRFELRSKQDQRTRPIVIEWLNPNTIPRQIKFFRVGVQQGNREHPIELLNRACKPPLLHTS